MNHAKLVFLINDTFDAVERSKVGQIYLRKPDGEILTTPEGCPYCNMGAMQIFQTALQAQIISKGIAHED